MVLMMKNKKNVYSKKQYYHLCQYKLIKLP